MVLYRVLGPLEVERDGRPIEIVGKRQRALLEILLLRANHVVTVETIVDELWGDDPPPTAVKALHNAISQLRKLLGDDAIATRDGGYRLQVAEGALDLDGFERRYAEQAWDEALALWRGDALADLRDYAFAQGDLRRLTELRQTAAEEQIEVRLAAGENASLVPELEALVARNPYRERLRGQLMRALYRSGRQAEALDAYHAARRALIDELGIEPSHALQDLHSSILRQEPGVAAASSDSGESIDDALRALLTGTAVPVLGSGVPLDVADDDLAKRLRETFDCPPGLGLNLARVSEYVALTEGIGPLQDALHSFLDRDSEPGPAHRFLAQLPPMLRDRPAPQLLIVTTTYDEVLEEAFRQAGEPFDTVAYIARGTHRGKFLHTSPDDSSRVVETPNVDTSITTDKRPVILKIHGCVDRRPAREWESFVVSEDDYIDYLASVKLTNAVPVMLAAKLRRSHFLFLAYGVADWNLRVFLRRIWGDDRVEYRSWAVQPKPSKLERDFWRHRNVELVDRTVDDYVAELARRASGLEAVRA
jgi:DNA-binding SARP family transcriptional activator